jgi:hypothetical protein
MKAVVLPEAFSRGQRLSLCAEGAQGQDLAPYPCIMTGLDIYLHASQMERALLGCFVGEDASSR